MKKSTVPKQGNAIAFDRKIISPPFTALKSFGLLGTISGMPVMVFLELSPSNCFDSTICSLIIGSNRRTTPDQMKHHNIFYFFSDHVRPWTRISLSRKESNPEQQVATVTTVTVNSPLSTQSHRGLH